jgi:hypothetical protein
LVAMPECNFGFFSRQWLGRAQLGTKVLRKTLTGWRNPLNCALSREVVPKL